MASKWEVWLANLDPVIGSEQGKIRPVLVISNEDVNKFLNAINIIPFTTKKKERVVYPNEVLIPSGNFGLKNESLILIHQIRTVDRKRLVRKLGVLSDVKIQKNVYEALKFQFNIN